MHDQPTHPPYVQPGDLLPDFLRSFWRRQVDTAEQETPDFRHPPLPLARIKKVMKSDPDVKMIAADAPILFCKACEIFIAEITARAFIVADSNKRRTLSRADIAKALSKSDQFDFLIDIVPREEGFPGAGGSSAAAAAASGSGNLGASGSHAVLGPGAGVTGGSGHGAAGAHGHGHGHGHGQPHAAGKKPKRDDDPDPYDPDPSNDMDEPHPHSHPHSHSHGHSHSHSHGHGQSHSHSHSRHGAGGHVGGEVVLGGLEQLLQPPRMP